MTRTIIAAIFLTALLASPLFAGSNTFKDYEQLRRLRVASDNSRSNRVWYSAINVKAGQKYSIERIWSKPK